MAVLFICMMIFAVNLQNCCVSAGNIVIYKSLTLDKALTNLLNTVKQLLKDLLALVDALLGALAGGLNLGGLISRANDMVGDLTGNVRNALGMGLFPRTLQRMSNNNDDVKEKVDNIKDQVKTLKSTFAKIQRESEKRGDSREIRSKIMETRRTLNTALSGLDFLLNAVVAY